MTAVHMRNRGRERRTSRGTEEVSISHPDRQIERAKMENYIRSELRSQIF
jgi:hypothetical protein